MIMKLKSNALLIKKEVEEIEPSSSKKKHLEGSNYNFGF